MPLQPMGQNDACRDRTFWTVDPHLNHLKIRPPYFDDHHRYHSVLQGNETRLFSSERPRIEVVFGPSAGAGPNGSSCRTDVREDPQYLESPEDVDRFLATMDPTTSDVFFIFRQYSTWSEFDCSSCMFRKIAAAINIFPPFVDFLTAFGFKLHASDETFGGYNMRVYPKSDTQGASRPYELIYDMRYPEEHGRDLRDPWSMRHTAVYQRYNPKTDTSFWVILQPSETSCNQLRSSVKNIRPLREANPLALHMMLLWSFQNNWRSHVNYLESELSSLEDKALFSRVGRQCRVDFAVAFEDCQNLQHLRKKLRRASAALDCSIGVITGYGSLCREALVETEHASGDSQWRIYESYLKTHKRNLDNLLGASSDVLEMLLRILDYRNDELLIRTSEATNKNSDSMRTLAEATKEDNRAMAVLAEKSQRDSSIIRILTVITMIYLPASLVAGVLSTDLVRFGSMESSATNRHSIRIATEFWVLPVFSLILLVFTFASVFGWVSFQRFRETENHVI